METQVEVVLVSAKNLRDTKLFGKMSPCAVVSVPDTSMARASKAAHEGGTDPCWNHTMLFRVMDSAIQKRPDFGLRVEIFDSAELEKSLGVASLPVAASKAFESLGQRFQYTLDVIHKNHKRGTLLVYLKCQRGTTASSLATHPYAVSHNAAESRASQYSAAYVPPTQAASLAAPGNAYSLPAHSSSAYPGYMPPASMPSYQAGYASQAQPATLANGYTVTPGYFSGYSYPPSAYSSPSPQVVVVARKGMHGYAGLYGWSGNSTRA